MEAPLIIGVYDKAFTPKGEIGAPRFVTVNLVDISLGFGRATISCSAKDRMIDHLMTPGGRIWLRRPDGEHLMSGPIVARRATGPSIESTYEFAITDDAAVLDEIVGWVQPANSITSQGTGATNWVLEDNAETVLKTAVSQNGVSRLGMPITVAPDLGRGSVVRGVLRMEPLWSKLFPVVDGCGMSRAGIGVVVKQSGAGLVLDVYERSTYPRPLSEFGGSVVNWSWSQAAPTATRVVVGGPGTGVVRSFRTVTDAPRETEIGRIIERWRDARDVDPAELPELYVRGQEILDEGAAKYGLAVTFAETDGFRYGKSVRVGDTVTAQLGSVPITDTLTEALLSWTRDDGWKVEPRVGDKSDDTDRRLGRLISKIGRSVARMQRT